MTPIDFSRAVYAGAAHHQHQWPPDIGAEVAFAGRSNAGKSSAINAIANQNRLAKTSKTPGRTRQIVFFELPDSLRLVDLPGYGYAKAPAHLRKHWQGLVSEYLCSRQCLRAVVIPMDIRRPLTESDMAMLAHCRELGLAAHVLLTKADKLKRGPAAAALLRARAQIDGHGREHNRGQDSGHDGQTQATLQLFSAPNKQGVDQARKQLTEYLRGRTAASAWSP